MKTVSVLLTIVFGCCVLISCNSQEKDTLAIKSNTPTPVTSNKNRNLSQEFKDYWYAGNAEITSYKLIQERYGELREGSSVNVFVTEDFLPKVQVKADNASKDNIPVLKLNQTKKYLTGIYPYSVMTSTFSPVQTTEHASKISHSMQEWCGHVYVQLNNKKKFEVESHSYFEGEADQMFKLEKTWLENELFNLIRINPEELPTGDNISIIPSFEYARMSHKKPKAYMASASLKKGDSISSYTLAYDNEPRQLKIYFSSDFPFTIERWEETHANGLVTTAVKKKRIKTAYWSQNSNKHTFLRDSLGI